ncbi:hypothetical protein [Pluralibacter gergoviae]|uniref:hypothetical protein n=1 Tax=Pluralibacter gergoviae TaxID=61647 RepID=UPI00138E1B08|nr:hypothetical protein [Pluralibacter gergoviae]
MDQQRAAAAGNGQIFGLFFFFAEPAERVAKARTAQRAADAPTMCLIFCHHTALLKKPPEGGADTTMEINASHCHNGFKYHNANDNHYQQLPMQNLMNF